MRRTHRPAGAAVTAALSVALGMISGTATATTTPRSVHPRPRRSAPAWRLQTFSTAPITVAGEGVASYPGGRILYRGLAQVPPAVARLGFNHVGDEDIDPSGAVYDAYENDHPNPTSKLFTITAPSGRVSVYPHPLAHGEEFNNSFVTVSPDQRWIVSGEWDTERRLLLLPNPKGRPSGSSLPLAGTITLRPALYHVQGCDFFSARTLICSTDDAVHSLVQVRLTAPLHRGTNHAVARRLLIPREVSRCPGRGFESEGVDYNGRTGRLTLTMNEPGACIGTTDVNVYRLVVGPSAPAIGAPLADGTPMPAGSRVGAVHMFTVPIDARAAGGRAVTSITLWRDGRRLAGNGGGHGRRSGSDPTLITPRLAAGRGYELRITSVGANHRRARARVGFTIARPASS
ncbi:MAG TPA: hypothetical protein VFN55_16275 [Solirubrobacteraceae bacterium]|nr:hypothetical protein [Solirubrobacteraceae bacterium]